VKPSQPYTRDFFQRTDDPSRRSALAIVPLVLELVKPASVADVGCGTGIWLSVFRQHGIADVLGIDGAYVEESQLEIPVEQFMRFDLTESLALDRSFDLVVSLEVAEHLPARCAETFVESLTRLGPIVLFSAAIPFQGGVHHVNEQWPDYWARLFRERDYVAIDCIRKRVWQDALVHWWYAQNTLLYARRDVLASRPLLAREAEMTADSQLSIVHPAKYLATANLGNIALRKVLASFPSIVATAIRRTLRIGGR
jgi:SAM-dependent methyltransferase